jgi:nucleotide-binding universal stress UspA family protein
MLQLPRILFATDGSACAERARHYAMHLADHVDAALHVVHVEERPAELRDVIEVEEADVLSDLHSVGAGDAAVAAPRVRERQVVHPSAAEGLLAYATEHDVRLLVLGTHGRRGLRRLVLGSVAEEVVRRSEVPVLTVGRGASAAEPTGGRLLVPVDFSEHQAPLLAHAREWALAYDMAVTLVHVVELEGVPDVYGLRSQPPNPDALAERTREALSETADDLRAHGLDVQVDVRTGHAAPGILEAADALAPDLLAVATHGRSGVDRVLMGSVAESVLRQAPCPVLTVKSHGRSLTDDRSPGAS